MLIVERGASCPAARRLAAASANRSASSTCPCASTISASARWPRTSVPRSSSGFRARGSTRGRASPPRSRSPGAPDRDPLELAGAGGVDAAPISSKSSWASSNDASASANRLCGAGSNPRRARARPGRRGCRSPRRAPRPPRAALRLVEVEPREVRAGELHERQALEVLAPALPAISSASSSTRSSLVEVALPPARSPDAASDRSKRSPVCVREDLVRPLAEPPRRRDVGVPVERDLRQGREREPFDRPFAGLVRELAHVLHLAGGRAAPTAATPRGPPGTGGRASARARACAGAAAVPVRFASRASARCPPRSSAAPASARRSSGHGRRARPGARPPGRGGTRVSTSSSALAQPRREAHGAVARRADFVRPRYATSRIST